MLGLCRDRHVDHLHGSRRRPRARRGHGRAEAEVADAADRGADSLLVRADRARRRLGRRADEVDRGAEGRRVRPERIEDVHHERGPRRVDRRLRKDRSHRRPPWDLRLHRPDGHRGRDHREAPGQDGPARNRHVGVRALGRRRSGREPARRGGRRLQDRDADARHDPARNGDRRCRRRARGVRVRMRVLEGAASPSASRSR